VVGEFSTLNGRGNSVNSSRLNAGSRPCMSTFGNTMPPTSLPSSTTTIIAICADSPVPDGVNELVVAS
jgi:hypothetical protein